MQSFRKCFQCRLFSDRKYLVSQLANVVNNGTSIPSSVSTSSSSYLRFNYSTALPQSLPETSIKSAVAQATTRIKVQVHFPLKKKMDWTRLHLSSAILRYQLGDERFQLSLVLKSGKLFNFDRAVTETLESFETRIKTNMTKKLKDSEVTARLVLPPEFKATDPMKPFLDHLVTAAAAGAQFEINENSFQISINPPEVSNIKFQDRPLAGFPFLPVKLETSQNFELGSSLFLWEYTKDRKSGAAEANNKKGKKPGAAPAKGKAEVWSPLSDSKGLVLNVDPALEGATLRLTVTPSDGSNLGLPFTAEVSNPVAKVPVSELLYEERLARLDPIDSNDPNLLRFLSYNILADTYATPEWFCNSPAESLPESYRFPILEREISSYNADIICLQEVEDRTFEGQLEPFMSLTKNFPGVFSCKSGSTREGVATFYNPQKLNLLENETINLSSVLNSLPFYDQVRSLPGLAERVQERNTVLQLLVLENKNEENSLLILAVTHLYFHPNADHIRLLQTIACISSIQAKLKQIREAHPGRKVRVFFAGDFNCTPPFSSYRLLTTGKVEANDDDWTCHEPEKIVPGIEFQHDLSLENSHAHVEELTNITLCFEGCIDYILYQPLGAQLIKAYPPPNKARIASICGCQPHHISLPNLYAPSDHLPLISDFRLV